MKLSVDEPSYTSTALLRELTNEYKRSEIQVCRHKFIFVGGVNELYFYFINKWSVPGSLPYEDLLNLVSVGQRLVHHLAGQIVDNCVATMTLICAHGAGLEETTR